MWAARKDGAEMRITNRLVTENSIQNMSENLERLYRLQQQAASGQKYLYASENPAVAADGMTLRSNLKSIETYNNAINSTKQWMESTDFSLQKIVDVLDDAQLVALKGLDDSIDVEERKILGTEIDGLIQQALEMVNYQDMDRYIFSGYMTNTKPFEMSTTTVTVEATVDENGNALPAPPPAHPTETYTVDTVVYNGDSNMITRDIARNESVTVNINGSTTFMDGTDGGQVYDTSVDDMFANLIRVRDYLLNEDYLKVHADSAGTAIPGDDASLDPTIDNALDRNLLSEAYGHLQDITSKITQSMTTNGARLKNLTTTLERSEKATLEIKSILSQNEEVNWAEVYSEIDNQEMVYQATINISSKINSMLNLFDMLQ